MKIKKNSKLPWLRQAAFALAFTPPISSAPTGTSTSPTSNFTVNSSNSLIRNNSTLESEVKGADLPTRRRISIPLKRHAKDQSAQRKRSGSVDVYDAGNDYSYSGIIEIGNPPQEMQVLLDTGSTLLMVYGPNYNSEQNLALALDTPRGPAFYPQKSSTFSYVDLVSTNQPQSVTYTYADQLFFTASIVQDTLTLGGYELCNGAWTLGKNGNYTVNNEHGSGILGLSWSSINSAEDRYDQTFTIGLIEQLWHLGALEEPLFALNLFTHKELGSGTPDGTQNAGGHLTIGGTDSSLYQGDIAYAPLVVDPTWSREFPGSWTAHVDGWNVNGETLPESGFDCLFDSGNTFSHLPHSLLQNIFSKVDQATYPVYYNEFQSTWYFLCPEELPPPFESITLNFAGRQIDFPYWSLVRSRISTGDGDIVCTLSPQSQSDAVSIFGDDFLRTIYSVYRFDPPSIGLATLATGLIESEDPQALDVKNQPIIRVDNYDFLGTQVFPTLSTPSALPAQPTFQSVDNPSQLWNTRTEILPYQPTFLGLASSSPTSQPTISLSKTDAGSSETVGLDGKVDGNGSESLHLSPLASLFVATFSLIFFCL